MSQAVHNKKLIVWIDDLLDSWRYEDHVEPLKEFLSAHCELVGVTSIPDLANTLRELALAQRKIHGLLIDMMLMSQARHRNFAVLGAESVSIVPHAAGAQIARLLLAPQYAAEGDTPAADFLVFHRGCGIAVMSTCFSDAGPEHFAKADAQDICASVTQIYEMSRQARARATEQALLAWLASLA